MQNILTHKTASVTELREPNKVIADAGDTPVAIMNRNNVVGYYVPAKAVELIDAQPASDEEVLQSLKRRKIVMQPVNDYLRDK
jgi:PHD/YefM family antitoxin component YafN of YafNO toxin-antitoxin module